MPTNASAATTTASGVSTISPQKRKRSAQNGPPLKRPSAPSPGKMSTGHRASGGGGLVDYDDTSDSDGSSGAQSPVIKGKTSIHPTSPSPSSGTAGNGGSSIGDEQMEERLEEDLGDVAAKMRAKRAREEEEEEGFAGLLVKKKDEAGSAAAEPAAKAETSAVEKKEAVKSEDKREDAKKDSKKEEGGKKIRLSFGSFKRLGGGAK